MNAWLIEHEGAWTAPVLTKLETVQSGPFVASLRVSMRVAASEMALIYELRAGDPRLHLHLQVTWLERGTPELGTPVLRLAVPIAFASSSLNPRTFFEIPFGSIERAMAYGEEVPALRWAAVEGGPDGARAACVLFNDSKHGHSFHGGTLALTLLRSSYVPDPLPEIGVHEVRCALSCVSSPFDPAAASRAAAAFEQELQVVSTTTHEGTLPPEAGLIRVEGGVLSGLKAAQDGGGIVVRLYNPGEKEITARIGLSERLGKVSQAEETDLLERPLKGVPVKDGSVSVHIPARGIRSLKLALAR
jgi:alpha-mannosidase